MICVCYLCACVLCCVYGYTYTCFMASWPELTLNWWKYHSWPIRNMKDMKNETKQQPHTKHLCCNCWTKNKCVCLSACSRGSSVCVQIHRSAVVLSQWMNGLVLGSVSWLRSDLSTLWMLLKRVPWPGLACLCFYTLFLSFLWPGARFT